MQQLRIIQKPCVCASLEKTRDIDCLHIQSFNLGRVGKHLLINHSNIFALTGRPMCQSFSVMNILDEIFRVQTSKIRFGIDSAI